MLRSRACSRRSRSGRRARSREQLRRRRAARRPQPPSSSRSLGRRGACRRARATVSATSAVHHSSSSTRSRAPGRARPGPSAGTASALNAASSSCLASMQRSSACSAAAPSSVASTRRDEAVRRASLRPPRRLSPRGRGDSSSTAAVPATDASHQPASRSGTMLIVPGEAAGSTYGSSAPFDRRGSVRARQRPRRTRRTSRAAVTIAASAVEELTAVPIVSSTLPASASATCAREFLAPGARERARARASRTPPKAANVRHLQVADHLRSRTRTGRARTTAARTARNAAGSDHTGRQYASVEAHLEARTDPATDDREAASDTQRV